MVCWCLVLRSSVIGQSQYAERCVRTGEIRTKPNSLFVAVVAATTIPPQQPHHQQQRLRSECWNKKKIVRSHVPLCIWPTMFNWLFWKRRTLKCVPFGNCMQRNAIVFVKRHAYSTSTQNPDDFWSLFLRCCCGRFNRWSLKIGIVSKMKTIATNVIWLSIADRLSILSPQNNPNDEWSTHWRMNEGRVSPSVLTMHANELVILAMWWHQNHGENKKKLCLSIYTSSTIFHIP